MDFQALLQQQLGQRQQFFDMPLNDTAEQIQISSLALLKMLKHGNYFNIYHRQGGSPYGSHGSNAW